MKNEDKILKTIDYITSLAGLEGYQLTSVRFVKFLYLAELLYIQHAKERLTDWEWIFWDYGPYCTESLQSLDLALQKKLIASISYNSKFDEENEYRLISYPRDQYQYKPDLEKHVQDLEKDIPIMVQFGMKSYIKKFGDKTTELLNHVYFQTEPMKRATPRTKLNFDSVVFQQPEKLDTIKLSYKNGKKAKEAIERLKARMLNKKKTNLELDSKNVDPDYILGMKILNNLDEEEDVTATGYASILNFGNE